MSIDQTDIERFHLAGGRWSCDLDHTEFSSRIAQLAANEAIDAIPPDDADFFPE